jgi:hypothetical protein
VSTFSPAYRLRVYAPRSTDATEATVLSPAGSAPHAEQFKVCSRKGLTGYQPYLGEVRGRRGAVDPLEKKTDAGQLSVSLLDARVSTGNAQRWVTAFVGDALGMNLLVGRKVVIEESLDYDEATGTGTWTSFFTGRITNVRLRNKIGVELELRDNADDMDVDIFVGAPHASAGTYAFMSPVAPIGLTRAFAGFPVGAGLSGTVTGTATDPDTGLKTVKITISKTSGDTSRTITTKALKDLNNRAITRGGVDNIVGYVYATISGVEKKYNFDWCNLIKSTSIEDVFIHEIAGGDAAPAMAAAVTELRIVPKDARPTKNVPLLIDGIHPVTLWRYILSGYFGPLTAAGTVRWTVPYNAAAFTALEADTSLPTMRFVVTDSAKMNEWIEANICKPLHLAYYLNGAGEVVPVDLRRASTTAATGTLTNADLVDATQALGWVHSGEAVTSILCTYYADYYIKNAELPKPFEPIDFESYVPPDIPVTRVAQLSDYPIQVLDLSSRTSDLKGRKLAVDAKGLRFVEGEKVNGVGSKRQAIEAYLRGFQEQIKGPFGAGAAYTTLACARSSALATSTQPGHYVVLDIDELPDPASNTRGGARLALCVGRQEDGLVINLLFLDAGPNAVAVAPTIGTPTVAAINDKYRVAAAITVNASAEYVELHYNPSAPGTASRPGDTDAGWVFGALVTASGTALLENMPLDSRVWVRARSVGETSAGHKDKLPSAWTYPAGTGYVDVTLGAGGISGLSAGSLTLSTATLSWTNSNTTDEVEVLVTAAGAAPSVWTDELRVAVLPAGTTSFTLHHLDSTTAHVAAIRLRGGSTGTSTPVTVSFTTTSTPNVCPTPIGITVALS